MVTARRISRRAVAIALVCGAVVGISGCSASDEAGEGGSTIVMGMNSGLIPQFQAYVDVYNSIDPDNQVELQPVPDATGDYLQQLITQNISGDLPDIIFNGDTLNAQFTENDLLFDLAPWLNEGKDGLTNDFIPAFVDQYIADPSTGAITGLPVSADSTMLFYNKTLFQKAGVTELPTDDWTWEDVYRVAKQISSAGDGQYWGLRTPILTGDAIFVDYPFLSAGGSEFYDADAKRYDFANEAGLETWEFMLQPYTEGWGSPFPVAGDATDYFAAGKVAMTLDTRPAIARFRDGLTDDWDVVNLPTYNGKPTVGGGSYALAISQGSDNKDAAWKFLAWFYSNEGGMKEAEPNGVIPATEDGIDNGGWRNDTNSVPANLIPATEYAVTNAQLSPVFPISTASDLGPALLEAVQQVVLNGESVDTAFTTAQDKLNALID